MYPIESKKKREGKIPYLFCWFVLLMISQMKVTRINGTIRLFWVFQLAIIEKKKKRYGKNSLGEKPSRWMDHLFLSSLLLKKKIRKRQKK